METLKNNNEPIKEVKYNSIENNTEQYKNEINKVLSQNATEQLSDIFGLTKEQTKKLANENEINKDEAKLAKMFGKYNEMLKLEHEPFSLASVMTEYDAYEERIAA